MATHQCAALVMSSACHDPMCLLLQQGQADRVNYLMTKQAKVVAMTCTHAALRRGEFLRLGFQYDNLLMEESAQILEIETFIPLLLQVLCTAFTPCFPLHCCCAWCADYS